MFVCVTDLVYYTHTRTYTRTYSLIQTVIYLTCMHSHSHPLAHSPTHPPTRPPFHPPTRPPFHPLSLTQNGRMTIERFALFAERQPHATALIEWALSGPIPVADHSVAPTYFQILSKISLCECAWKRFLDACFMCINSHSYTRSQSQSHSHLPFLSFTHTHTHTHTHIHTVDEFEIAALDRRYWQLKTSAKSGYLDADAFVANCCPPLTPGLAAREFMREIVSVCEREREREREREMREREMRKRERENV